MERPLLTFACELGPEQLTELFAGAAVIADLQVLGARVALMLSDFSDQRAAVVRQLNAAGVPVVGIPLLPLADGYYFTTDNAAKAATRYGEFRQWTQQHGLTWEGVGLDIEPDAHIYQQMMDNPWGLPRLLLPRLLNGGRPARASADYGALVARIRADGWSVENYQFPLIADERWAKSDLLQRLALVDVATDREVWMLYSSFMRRIGPGLIWVYGPEAPAIGVGTTGGGPDIPGSPQMPSLSWEELARDLRLARHWSGHLLIHSLEGCAQHGYLSQIRDFDWDQAADPPRSAWAARGMRASLRGALWAAARPAQASGVALTSAAVARIAWHRVRRTCPH